MRMNFEHQTRNSSFTSDVPVPLISLQRKCECGQHTAAAGKCDACRREQERAMPGSTVNNVQANAAPPIINDALTKSSFEHDFSHVPAHTNARTNAAAQADEDAREPLQSSGTQPTSVGVLTQVEHHRQPFSATIRRAAKTHSSFGGIHAAERQQVKPRIPAFYSDAMPGQEQTSPVNAASLLAQTAATGSAGAIREIEEGETVRLPDIALSPAGAIEQTDAIASALAYNSSVTQAGAQPGGFGVTLPYTHAISGITVTRAAGTFTVAATVDNPITFQVRTTTGPDGQLDIAADTDSDITATNYPTVVSDLTPDMSDLNGRPPRATFFARDLTVRHERFHADEDVVHGQSGVTLARNWLNTQTAGSVADVNALLAQVPARVAATVDAAMAYPGREERAYADGAPLYLARANAIKTKGDAGQYPATSGAAPGLSRGAKVGIGVAGGAAVGAGIGALAGGPVGAAVGAGIGALAGLIGGLIF